MKKTITLLRISYWWGIIADAVMSVLLLIPTWFLTLMRISLPADYSVQYGLLNAVPLMAGWTLLLVWADRKPVERSGVLLITLPVIAGFMVIEIITVCSGLVSFVNILPLLIQQSGMISLFIISYSRARKLTSL